MPEIDGVWLTNRPKAYGFGIVRDQNYSKKLRKNEQAVVFRRQNDHAFALPKTTKN